MTFPCINEDEFEMVDGTHVTPLEHMQWRHVAVGLANDVTETLVAADGVAKNILIHTVQAEWTNTSPVTQNVYGLITRGGSRVVLMARSRAYIQINSGQVVGVAPADPATSTVLSKFGCGAYRGLELFTNPRFMVVEHRIGERTGLIGDTNAVAPGETVKVRAAVSFVSDNWESVAIYGGTGENEAGFTSGATQIDLYAYPVL